jgi:hypothetical protein
VSKTINTIEGAMEATELKQFVILLCTGGSGAHTITLVKIKEKRRRESRGDIHQPQFHNSSVNSQKLSLRKGTSPILFLALPSCYISSSQKGKKKKKEKLRIDEGKGRDVKDLPHSVCKVLANCSLRFFSIIH